MIKPSYGIIVGRFQVNDLHPGHMELFREVRGRHMRVIVFVGVSPTDMSRSNPLDFETRKKMIQAKFPEFTVLPMPDFESDELWSETLDKRIHDVVSWGDVTLYGGRDSFVPHYTGGFKPVELCLHYSLSGSEVREALTNTVMESSDFRAGIIYAANNLRPRVVTCVDIIIARDVVTEHHLPLETKFLLAQKLGETGWRFVGGHAEAVSPNFESDAKREAYEETGCDVNSIEYIGSSVIDDWRWRKDPDKIKTLVFLGWTSSALAKAADDVESVKWFTYENLTEDLIVPSHRPIFTLLTTHMEKKNAISVPAKSTS
jgi:bifunctional NMN adenylyltransferase/nudix hydrolase